MQALGKCCECALPVPTKIVSCLVHGVLWTGITIFATWNKKTQDSTLWKSTKLEPHKTCGTAGLLIISGEDHGSSPCSLKAFHQFLRKIMLLVYKGLSLLQSLQTVAHAKSFPKLHEPNFLRTGHHFGTCPLAKDDEVQHQHHWSTWVRAEELFSNCASVLFIFILL